MTAQPRPRRWFGGTPGPDTPLAALSVLAFWGVYWAGTQVNPLLLYAGVLAVGTLLPAWAVFALLRGSWSDLGITRHRLVLSLAVAAVFGAGSAFQVFQLAAQAGVDPWSHIVANVLVFWEPFFVFGWLYLAWERAFGIVPAVALTSVGFALQHVGSVGWELVASFGAFGALFAIIFAVTRNLLILWPLAYGVSSGIGTLQSGLHFGWDVVVPSAALLLGQFVILAVADRWWLRPERAATVRPA